MKVDFKFKHKFGQNFLSDTNLLAAITKDAGIDRTDNVLEIGAGAGALTFELAKATDGQVIAFEIDKTLEPLLTEKLKNFTNVSIVYEDFLNTKDAELNELFADQKFKVVANLPYYISTPILFKLIESQNKIESITIMVQKELAQRLAAQPNSKAYGALTVILSLYGEVKLCRNVSRKLFTPEPNVDSCIINIKIKENKAENISFVSKVVKMCFAMRRKTVCNNLIKGLNIDRAEAEKILTDCNIALNARAEQLEQAQYLDLTKKIREKQE